MFALWLFFRLLNLEDVVASSPPTQKWKFDVGGSIVFPAAISPKDGTIYFGSFDYYIYAVNPDGSKKWSVRTNNAIWSGASLAKDGTVYIGSNDFYLYAVSPSGTVKWKFKTGGFVDNKPLVGDDGTIYIGSRDFYLYALNPDGKQKWRCKTGGVIHSSPAMSPDGKVVYIGSFDANLWAIQASDGSEKWKFKSQYNTIFESSPLVAPDGTIYVGTDAADNALYAISPSGSKIFRFAALNTIGAPIGSLAVARAKDGTIYFGSGDWYLYALAPDGKEKWKYKTDGWIDGTPNIGPDGTIYVGTEGFHLHAVGSDGALKWKLKFPGWVESTPVWSADSTTMFIGCSAPASMYALSFAPSHPPGWCNPAWPKFANQGALQNDPWGSYLSSVYGELPTDGFPMCMAEVWMFYDAELSTAGVTKIPKIVGTCPTNPSEMGQHYQQNNMFSPSRTSWSWQPHPYTAFPGETFVEVIHEKDPFGDEHYGAWLMYAKGSGIWFHLGKTIDFPTHQDAYKHWNKFDNEGMSKAAAADGYDSVQFLAHEDPVEYKQCDTKHTGVVGLEYMNIEIVATKLVGSYPCGTASGAPSTIRAGWKGSKECACDGTADFLNCKGVPGLSTII